MDGTNCTTGTYLNPASVDPSWNIVGTGDFNGDGQTDILLQHTSGWLAIWYMNSTSLIGGEFLKPAQVDPSWRVVGSQ